MKVYQVVYDPYKQINPYVRTILDEIEKNDSSVEFFWGIDSFWSNRVFEFDIIHFHWPEILLFKKKSIIEISERIRLIKERNIKIVATCHNLNPHVNIHNGEDIYRLVYENADTIFHLGNYSLSLFQSKYPKARNILCFHHVYDRIYTKVISKEDSIVKLKLDIHKKYILCFGAFRTDEERQLISKVHDFMSGLGYEILAPGFATIHLRRNPIKSLKSIIDYLVNRIKYPHIICSAMVISDKDVPYYFAASNICFIQRINILNSGNLPLALYMGNLVIGPDVGNVGPLLKETHNITFNPKDQLDIQEAFKKVIKLPEDLANKNREWAINNLSTSKIANIILSEYYLLL